MHIFKHLVYTASETTKRQYLSVSQDRKFVSYLPNMYGVFPQACSCSCPPGKYDYKKSELMWIRIRRETHGLRWPVKQLLTGQRIAQRTDGCDWPSIGLSVTSGDYTAPKETAPMCNSKGT